MVGSRDRVRMCSHVQDLPMANPLRTPQNSPGLTLISVTDSQTDQPCCHSMGLICAFFCVDAARRMNMIILFADVCCFFSGTWKNWHRYFLAQVNGVYNALFTCIGCGMLVNFIRIRALNTSILIKSWTCEWGPWLHAPWKLPHLPDRSQTFIYCYTLFYLFLRCPSSSIPH